MSCNRSADAYESRSRSGDGRIADRRVAKGSRRPARRRSAFVAQLVFGLKLAASTLAGAFVTFAFWSMAAKPVSTPPSDRYLAAGADRVTDIVRAGPKQPATGTDAGGEADGPSSFPKPVKTVTFTPPAS